MNKITEEIDAIRGKWGNKLLILGHHYQRDSVLAHADEIGDSLELARKAAEHSEAERIVFCGVRFMAESADILTSREQRVFMPDIGAGCPMARMADMPAMRKAWAVLGGADAGWLPVVYVNSSANVKACCGEFGGSCCTSSNATRVFEWVFSQGKRVFCLPDEHLGVNTAHDIGIADEQIIIYDPSKPFGGVHPETLKSARVVVWKGFCLVHTAFTTQQIAQVRSVIPQAKIIVHPEAPKSVVRLSDAHGSTSQIRKYVESSPDGSVIFVGTELNFVQRLAKNQAGRVMVKALSQSVCANMSKTNEQNLLSVLSDWPDANVVNIAKSVAEMAHKSLDAMLKL
ncbi:MAG: quinolinate synthase NadA [Lentisphaerae bacterium]|nr:quinolinate synthase NadA [Lentisphaerota bacterium]